MTMLIHIVMWNRSQLMNIAL